MTSNPNGWQDCPVCNGEGWTFEKDHRCQRCHGVGSITAAQAAESNRSDLTPIGPLVRRFAANAQEALEGEITSTCVDCGAAFQVAAIVLGLPPDWQKPFQRCEPCQLRIAQEADAQEVRRRRGDWDARIARWWDKVCARQPRYRSDSFATFRRAANGEDVATAYDTALRWADAFDWQHSDAATGLVLHSEVRGTGKTHLLLALCRRVLEGCAPTDAQLRKLVASRDDRSGGPAYNPVQFWKADDLLLMIDQSRRPVRFDADAPPRATEEEIYEGLAQVRVLAIDDLGQAPSFTSGMRQSAAWEKIIGDRYNRKLPVLLSTNLPVVTDDGHPHPDFVAVVGERAVSRLQEMVDFISVAGVDYRPQKRAATAP